MTATPPDLPGFVLARKCSAVLNDAAAWLLREPGAKLPPRAPLPPAAEEG